MSEKDLKDITVFTTRAEIRDGVELVKYLHKNELNSGLKDRLARLGFTLNSIMRGMKKY